MTFGLGSGAGSLFFVCALESVGVFTSATRARRQAALRINNENKNMDRDRDTSYGMGDMVSQHRQRFATRLRTSDKPTRLAIR